MQGNPDFYRDGKAAGKWTPRKAKPFASHQKKADSKLNRLSVRVIGLEPTRLAAPDPKSGMSTNFTIPAKM